MIVIVPSFVTVDLEKPLEFIYSWDSLSSLEISSIEIPTNPSVARVGCTVLFNTISPVFIILEPFFPIIPAVFLAVRDIPLSKAGNEAEVPEFVTVDL